MKGNKKMNSFKKISAIFIACVMMLSSVAFAAGEAGISVYVSPLGSDINGDGSETNPFATLNAAKEYVRGLDKSSGVEVIFKSGKYLFNDGVVFTAEDSGVNGNPVTYKAEEGADVIFTGAVTLNKGLFQKVEDTAVLRALPVISRDKVLQLDLLKQGIKISTEYPALYVNNTQATIARYPNEGFAVASNASGAQSFVPTGGNYSTWGEEGAKLIGSVSNGYDWSTVAITGFDGSAISLSSTIRKNAYYYVRNIIGELDAPGEYVIKNNILYYYPSSDLDELDMEIIAFSNSTMLELKGAEDISFEGIKFEKMNSSAITTGDVYTNRISITNCEFNYIIPEALDIRGYDHIITDNYSYGCGTRFIEIGGGAKENLVPGNILVARNRIVACGYWSPSVYGTIKGGINSPENWICIGNKIMNNIIQDCYNANAIDVTGNDNLIMYNEIFNQGRIIEDGGAIYSGKSATKYGTHVAYNYLHDFNLSNDYCALYSDDGMSGLSMHHNVIARVSKAMVSGMGANNNFSDNLLINVSSGMGAGTRMTWGDYYNEGGHFYREAYNIVYNANPAISEVYNAKYPEIKQAVDNYLEKGYPFFAPWNSVMTGNVSIGNAKAVRSTPNHKYLTNAKYTIAGENKVPTLSTYLSGLTLYVDELKTYGKKVTSSNGTNLNGTDAGNPKFNYSDSLFVDAANQNYTLNSKISDVSDVHNIDMTEIGIISTTNPAIFEQKDTEVKLTDVSFDNQKAVISWETVENASEYDIIVSKNADLSSPICNEKSYNIYHTNKYDVNLSGAGTYYYQIKAHGISREDMFTASSEIASFTVGILNKNGLENALSILKNKLDAHENGTFILNNKDSLSAGYEENCAVLSSSSDQTSIDLAEEAVYQLLDSVDSAKVALEITKFEPVENSTMVLVQAVGLPANSLTTVMVTNPEVKLEDTTADFSMKNIRFVASVLSDADGKIEFSFDTQRDEIDYTGVYDVYVKANTEDDALNASYTYGTVELSNVKFSNAQGEISKDDLEKFKGQEITLSMSVKNRTNRVITPEAYLGIYKSDMLDSAFVEAKTPINANSDGELTVKVTVPQDYTSDTEFKLFMWDDAKLLRPLTKTRYVFQ